MASEEPPPFPLLSLPDPCLLAVLRLCGADDQRSLFSAACAHSRLHQAAVAALSSITVAVPNQQHLDSVMLFLSKHSPPIDSLKIESDPNSLASLSQLPPYLRLSSLQLSCLTIQVRPGNGFQGMLGASAQVTALTQLRLDRCMLVESTDELSLPAAAAAAESQLKRLDLPRCYILKSATRAALLSHLQHMQQLTYLNLAETFAGRCHVGPPAAAYAALTASSKLQHLNLSKCWLPVGAWDHIFHADRQLPQLREVSIANVRYPLAFGIIIPALAPEGSRLVSCCPGLQSLDMRQLRCTAEQLAPLQGLSGLHTLLYT